MKANSSFLQFIKDGLVGLIVALVILGIVITIYVSVQTPPGEVLTLTQIIKGDLRIMFAILPQGNSFVNPMPFVLLIAFVISGFSGRFVENIVSRKSWLQPMIIVSLTSWLIGGGVLGLLSVVTFFLLHRFTPEYFSGALSYIIFTGVWSATAGFAIGYLIGVIFNPSRRLYKILIVSISIALINIANGVILFFVHFRY